MSTAAVPTRRLLVREDAPMHVMGELAAELDWVLADYLEPGPGQPEEEIYDTGRPGTRAHFLADPVLGVRYLFLHGPAAGELADELSGRAVFMPVGEALDALASANDRDDPVGMVDGLYFVAASAAPDQDDRVVAALDRAAGHDDPQIRRAVIVASGYLPWPPMRALLERLQSDPDEAVRRDAGIMLEGKDLYE
jgi:hypothetical protein